MITVMTIAGSDPSSGAGIAADIKTFCALSVNPACVVTSITSQNDKAFYNAIPVDPAMVKGQIEAVLEYYDISAVKIGMLYSKEILKEVSSVIAHHGLKNVVLDPLVMSSTGKSLTDYDITHLKSELLPHVRLLTPNVKETEKLSGMSILKPDDLKEAALEISEFGCENIVITGFNDGKHCVDLLYDGEDFIELKKKLLTTPDLHGTGCTFSSAAAAFLAQGKSIKESVKEAGEFTYNAIKYAKETGDDKYVLNQFFMHGT